VFSAVGILGSPGRTSDKLPHPTWLLGALLLQPFFPQKATLVATGFEARRATHFPMTRWPLSCHRYDVDDERDDDNNDDEGDDEGDDDKVTKTTTTTMETSPTLATTAIITMTNAIAMRTTMLWATVTPMAMTNTTTAMAMAAMKAMGGGATGDGLRR